MVPRLPRAARLKLTSSPNFVAGYPKLLEEWHPTKNGDHFPYEAARGSIRRVWWRCSKNPTHEWQAIIANRVKGGECPICTGRVASTTTSLAARFPALAAEWHATKNGSLKPTDVTPRSSKTVWWRCAKGRDHVWQATVGSRARGGPCPFCIRRATSVTNAVSSSPKLRRQWHPTKNGTLKPSEVRLASTTRVWWRCSKGPDHEWQTAPRKRAENGCPFCAGRRGSVTNGFATRYPAIAAEFHPTKNGRLRVEMVTRLQPKAVWWQCSRDRKHEWRARPHARLRRGGRAACPHCRREATSLATLHPHIASEFHPSKNRSLRPETLAVGHQARVWWRCSRNPQHEWQARPQQRVAGGGCPLCAKERSTLAVIYPALAKEFDPARNRPATPTTVPFWDPKRYWWRCPKGHLSQRAIAVRLRRGCPTCAKLQHAGSGVLLGS